jgi:hypothetical protein
LQDRGDLLEERMHMFRALEEEFLALYSRAKQSICPTKMSLDEALDTLDQASNEVTAKVSASRILQGLHVTPEEMRTFLQNEKTDKSIQDHVQLLPECISVLSRAQQCNWNLGILSINWCPALIHATVLHSLEEQEQEQEKDGTPIARISSSTIPVWSNAVSEQGVVDLQVPGALAKKERILKLQNEHAHDTSVVVYVGDSSTDLAALAAADIGILIGGSQSTIGVARQFGIPVFSLQNYNNVDSALTKGAIWTTDNWAGIDEFLKQQSMI